jgi:CheY-like chemotaxis protein
VAHIKEEIIDEIKNQFHSAEKTYHVVFIMDEPNFDGLWIGKELQKAGITDKSIFFMISSSHKQENYVQTKVVGIDYYLTQPFEQNLLKNYLSDCIPGIQFEDDKPSEKIRQNLNILVAEDNLLNQKVAVTIFDHLGFKIDIANNGREVIEMIQKKPYDIVFMDLMMPDKDGIDATVEIRGLGFQIPIIAMTATASKTGKTNALNSGMNDYITKPVNMAMVKNVLLKWFS